MEIKHPQKIDTTTEGGEIEHIFLFFTLEKDKESTRMSRDWKIKVNPLREGDAIPAFTIFGWAKTDTINVFSASLLEIPKQWHLQLLLWNKHCRFDLRRTSTNHLFCWQTPGLYPGFSVSDHQTTIPQHNSENFWGGNR